MLGLVVNKFPAAKKEYSDLLRIVVAEKSQKCDWNGDESNFQIWNSRLDELVYKLLQLGDHQIPI